MFESPVFLKEISFFFLVWITSLDRHPQRSWEQPKSKHFFAERTGSGF